MHQPTRRNRIAAFPPVASEPALPLVIDAVAPSSRGGLAPVKRVIDEPLRVEADVLAEEGTVRVFVRWRTRGSLRWDEKPMVSLGDFRYGAELGFSGPGNYEYAVRVALSAGPGEAVSPVEALVVERTGSRSGAWVAVSVPRSAHGRALRESLPRLDALKRMGFDLAILPPLGDRGDEIDPSFGSAEDFAWLLRAALYRGMELAVTLPVGAPGALGYGENFPDRWEAWASRARRWVARGVRALACPDAHLAPVGFWRQLLAELRSACPEMIFLAGSGGSGKQQAALARAGFSASLGTVGTTESIVDLKRAIHDLHPPELADHARPCLWPEFESATTDHAARKVRIALAALLSPAWGISDRWIFAEEGPSSRSPFISQLNHIRRAHAVLREAGAAVICHCPQAGVLAFQRGRGMDSILVVLNVSPQATPVEARIHLPRASDSDRFTAIDLFTGRALAWRGSTPAVEVDAFSRVVRVFRVENEGGIKRSVLP